MLKVFLGPSIYVWHCSSTLLLFVNLKELEGTLFIIMEYISLCSIVFFYIAVGAQWRASRFEATAIGSFICLLAMVLPVISYCSVFDLKWYWAALLNFLLFLWLRQFCRGFTVQSLVVGHLYIIIMKSKRSVVNICMNMIC